MKLQAWDVDQAEALLPVVPKHEPIEVPGIRESRVPWDAAPGTQTVTPDTSGFFPAMAFIGMLLVLIFFLNHMYKCRTKPKRKKPPRLRRIQQSVYTRVPGV